MLIWQNYRLCIYEKRKQDLSLSRVCCNCYVRKCLVMLRFSGHRSREGYTIRGVSGVGGGRWGMYRREISPEVPGILHIPISVSQLSGGISNARLPAHSITICSIIETQIPKECLHFFQSLVITSFQNNYTWEFPLSISKNYFHWLKSISRFIYREWRIFPASF